MSRFFRSSTSSGSSSSESSEDDTEEVLSPSLEISRSNSQDVSGSALDALAIGPPRNGSAAQTQDMLIHTLLERDAKQRVLDQRRKAGKSLKDKTAIEQETREQYRNLVDNLARYNLVSHGLEDDRHASMRQRIGEGLDQMGSTAPSTPQATVPQSMPLLLTNAIYGSSAPEIGHPTTFLDNTTLGVSPQMQSRYVQDFEEMCVLGKGGFGEVYQVRHKLDNCVYAVKRIPIRASAMTRIATGGQAALDELLAEVRSLSKLQHPNVVRYHNSWIEWSTRNAIDSFSSDQDLQDSHNFGIGAEASRSFDDLDRVRTASDTNEDIGFTFEASHSQTSAIVYTSQTGSSDQAASIELTRSTTDFTNGALLSTEPTLALHLQMSVHPMTLADFLSPPPSDSMVKPLAHCFHLEPSIRILLALLDGVDYLHGEGVVHRDLKPANIFLRHEENPKAMHGCVDLSLCPDCCQVGNANPATLSVCIGDFGLVTQIAEPEAVPAADSTAVGTEIYRPTTATPPASPKLDIFALGIVACELICRFGTQMERRETLQSLRRGGFPSKFANCAGEFSSKLKECVSAMLGDGSDNNAGIPDLKRRLSDILVQSQKIGSNDKLRRVST
ncbi:Putative serine/threonine-protein kinase, active [Septoria linicola]|uniref:non-specific serine/threonine protein kinase n=1 Tax=Septoria linicola TaxID=215465 RepID=A0A9Q9B4R7_9PEZI|nr:Putative serine/threonine-protein kinase, active [Septoria linicola]